MKCDCKFVAENLWLPGDREQYEPIFKALLSASIQINSVTAQIIGEMDEDILHIIAFYAIGKVFICEYNNCEDEIFVTKDLLPSLAYSNDLINEDVYQCNTDTSYSKYWYRDKNVYKKYIDNQTGFFINAVCEKHYRKLRCCGVPIDDFGERCKFVDFKNSDRWHKCSCGKLLCNNHKKCTNIKCISKRKNCDKNISPTSWITFVNHGKSDSANGGPTDFVSNSFAIARKVEPLSNKKPNKKKKCFNFNY